MHMNVNGYIASHAAWPDPGSCRYSSNYIQLHPWEGRGWGDCRPCPPWGVGGVAVHVRCGVGGWEGPSSVSAVGWTAAWGWGAAVRVRCAVGGDLLPRDLHVAICLDISHERDRICFGNAAILSHAWQWCNSIACCTATRFGGITMFVTHHPT
jgi:hypothetical protein